MPISVEQFKQLAPVGEPGEKTRDLVYKTLADSESAMTQREIAETIDRREQHINRILHELLKEGKVERARGRSPGGRAVTYWIAIVKEATE